MKSKLWSVIALVLGLSAAGVSQTSSAQPFTVRVDTPEFGIRVGYPGYYPAPVIVAPAPVVVAPAPVYMPPPVYVPPRVIYAPAPVTYVPYPPHHRPPHHHHRDDDNGRWERGGYSHSNWGRSEGRYIEQVSIRR